MNKTPLFLILFIILLLFSLYSNGQDSLATLPKTHKEKMNNAILIAPEFTFQFPFLDMQKRFGWNSNVGLSLHYLFHKNWIIGVAGNFLFGKNVKENHILDSITTQNNSLIKQDGDPSAIRLAEQGFTIKFDFGKIIPFNKRHPTNGFMLITGVGFLQHKIAINVKSSDYPELDNNYKQGYDRLSNGPFISQFIGVIRLERTKFLSLYAGAQLDIGFTQGRRPWNFDTNMKDNSKRVDMFIGFKIGWIIPAFIYSDNKDYYY